MEKIILLIIILVEVIVIFMIENKNYMAIIVSLITLGVYYMLEMFYYKLYMKGSIGYNNFSPIAIVYGIIVITIIIISMYKAKKDGNKKQFELGKSVLILSPVLYIIGKGIIIYSEKGIDQISEEMLKTDFITSQVFRIIINSLIISYIISSIIKRKGEKSYGKRND